MKTKLSFNKRDYYELKNIAKEYNVKTARRISLSERYSGFTVAFMPATSLPDNRMVQVAISYCAVEDAFEKKIGKFYALDRFFDEKLIQLPIGQEYRIMDKNEFKKFILDILDIHYV